MASSGNHSEDHPAPARPVTPARRKSRGWLRMPVALGAVSLALASGMVTSLPLPGGNQRVESTALWWLAGLLWLAAVWPRLGPRAALFFSTLWLALLAAVLITYHPPRRGDQLRWGQWTPESPVGSSQDLVWVSPDEWSDPLTDQATSRFGHGGIPGARGYDHRHEFHVLSTLDGDGFRRMPAAAINPPRGEIDILGCSFTFGAGVADDETYAFRLARFAWPEWRVRNLAYSSYGPNHAHAVLEWRLAQSPAPRVVLYSWITHQARRVGLRQSWHSGAAAPFPRFVLHDGSLESLGLAPASTATRPDGPELDRDEMQLSAAIVRDMHRLCAARETAFVVLLLQRQAGDTLAEMLAEAPAVPVIDLCDTSSEYYVEDGHPTPRWHQAQAARLAEEPTLAQATGIAELQQPHRLAWPKPAWRLEQLFPGRRARRFDDGHAPLAIRVGDLPENTRQPWDVMFAMRGLRLPGGRPLRWELRGRATAQRAVQVKLVPSDGGRIPVLENWQLGPTWQVLRVEFTLPVAMQGLSLEVQLGGSAHGVEISGAHLWDGDMDLLNPEGA